MDRTKLIIDNVREAGVVIDYIVERIKRGLGVNILVVGAPGLGKSYVCLRISEMIYERLYNEKIYNPNHVVFNLIDAYRFMQKVDRPGEPLVIEEVSVLASSRRFMSKDNVQLNYLLDTCRKKQVVLMMNCPHFKFVDSHVKALAHILIECKRINKKHKVCFVKPLKLQLNSNSGKIYFHRFKLLVKQHGHQFYTDITESYFKKPNRQITKHYEEKKSTFLDSLYQRMEHESIKQKQDDMKKLGITIQDKLHRKPLTVKQERVIKAYAKLGSQSKAGAETGISQPTVHEVLKDIERKGYTIEEFK